MPTLVIDERERAWHLRFDIFCKAKFPEWQTEVRTIEVGDYAHADLLGIEHKSPEDFLSSLQSGRLFNQAHELAQAYQQAFIVVDGVPRQLWSSSYVPYSAENIHGVLASLAVRRRTPVLFTGSNEVDFMTTIVKLVDKTQGDGSFVYNPVRSKGTKRELARHLIAALPGVGPKRAATILEAYKTPLEALIDYKNWVKLDGIGNSTIQRAAEVLEQASDGKAQTKNSVPDLRSNGPRQDSSVLRRALQKRQVRYAPPDVLRKSGSGQDDSSTRPGS